MYGDIDAIATWSPMIFWQLRSATFPTALFQVVTWWIRQSTILIQCNLGAENFKIQTFYPRAQGAHEIYETKWNEHTAEISNICMVFQPSYRTGFAIWEGKSWRCQIGADCLVLNYVPTVVSPYQSTSVKGADIHGSCLMCWTLEIFYMFIYIYIQWHANTEDNQNIGQMNCGMFIHDQALQL